MNFSVAEIHHGPMYPMGSLLLMCIVYVAASVVLGRRFGARGLWGAWFAALGFLVLTFTINMMRLPHGPTGGYTLADALRNSFEMLPILGVPAAATALVLGWAQRRARPAGVPAQLALGMGAFILALPVAIVVFILAFLLVQ